MKKKIEGVTDTMEGKKRKFKDGRYYFNGMNNLIYYIEYTHLITKNPVGWTYQYKHHPIRDYYGWITYGTPMFNGFTDLGKTSIDEERWRCDFNLILIPKELEKGITCFESAFSPDIFRKLYDEPRHTKKKLKEIKLQGWGIKNLPPKG
jgi:hypothetical protein